MKKAIRLLAVLLVPVLLLDGCSSPSSFASQLSVAVSPYRFSISRWEISSISQEIDESFSDKDQATVDQSQTVVD